MNKQPTEHKYLKIAKNIEVHINTEVLKIGDKLPSVRIMQKEHGVSVSTILQAYYHLESKGLIEARPQSGYFVSFSPKAFAAEPVKSQPENEAKGQTAEEMIAEVYNDISNEKNINLSLNIPSPELLPVSKLNKAMVEAMRKLPAGGTSYENIQGNMNLRRQIAKRSIIWNGNLTSEDIITTTGCMNAVALSLMAVTERGDTIAVESPCYFGILQLASNLGLKIIELSTHPQTGIDIDGLKKVFTNHKIRTIVLMSNYNNPMGCCIPEANKIEIVRLIQYYGIALIEDDIYGDVYFSESRPKNCKSFDESGLVLWCSSVSKTLAPGYRVGWVAPGKYTEKIKRMKLYFEVSSATLQQEAIAIFLENGRYEHHLRKLRNTLHSNSLQYMRAVSEFFPSGTRVSRPQGGFLLWVEFDKSINTYDLYKKAIKHNISVAPGRMFTINDQYKNCMRLSYGMTWNRKIENSLKLIGKLASE